MKKNNLILISLIIFPILTQGQSNLSQLLFADNLDSCISLIIRDYDDNLKFEKQDNKKSYYKTYKLRSTITDSLQADSLIIRLSDTRIASSYPEYDVTTINILRHYTDIRTTNKAYNYLLDQLLNIEFIDRFPNTAVTDTSGTILTGPKDIILSTGYSFQFDNDSLHGVSLWIDYQLDYQNNWNVKQEFVLRLEYSKTKKKCK